MTARAGHLEVLQWAREHGCDWTEGTCYAAALGGHLEVLKWTHEHGCTWEALAALTCTCYSGRGCTAARGARGTSCHAPTGRPAICHAPTGRPATFNAPTGRPTTCHAPTSRPAICHAPTGRPATCHAPTGQPATCHTPTGSPATCRTPTGHPRRLSRRAGGNYAHHLIAIAYIVVLVRIAILETLQLGTNGQCSPRHQNNVEPSFLELFGIL